MRGIVIIGAGLSGLAAAAELEKLGVPYTIIEVKPRYGGSIQTHTMSNFIVDESAFAVGAIPQLSGFGLHDALVPLQSDGFIFRNGTQTLIDHLTSQIHAPGMHRMAVSSIGVLENRFMLCLENGYMLDAWGIIVAAPARFAERIFYGYIPEIATRLLDYQYDHILRVSLGYRKEDIHLPIREIHDMAYGFIHWTDAAGRVPQDHVLLQVGIRVDAQHPAEHIVQCIRNDLNLPQPVVQHIAYWAEADPISCYDDSHRDNMMQIQKALPDGIALIGSDYSLLPPMQNGVSNLEDRLHQGQQAAQKLAKFVNNRYQL